MSGRQRQYPRINTNRYYDASCKNRGYYIKTEMSSQGVASFTSNQPFPVQGFNGGQYVMIVPDNAVFVRHSGMDRHSQQPYTYVQELRPQNHYNNYVPATQWRAPVQLTDTRLNPNSKEFVHRKTEFGNKSASRFSSPGIDSERNISSCSESMEGVSTGLSNKLRNLGLRYESGDSGIAESSSSSTMWSSDDDVDGSISEEDKRASQQDEKIWGIADDKNYWYSEKGLQPNDSICYAIVRQLEFYMSNEYLSKDKYLLRQIRCKKDGYVSIKLMTSFKKMKKLAQTWQVLRSAICRMSKTLVVSAEGLRIKRREELPEELRKPRKLTSILAIRLPEKYNAVDKLTSLFRIFGEIGLVRLLRPEKLVPVDLRNYATQVPDIGMSLCAVIEFESATDALEAVRVLKNRHRDITQMRNSEEEANDDQEGLPKKETELSEDELEKLKSIQEEQPDLGEMRVALLGPRVRRTLYRQDRNKSTETASTSSRFTSEESDSTGMIDVGHDTVISKGVITIGKAQHVTEKGNRAWRGTSAYQHLQGILKSPRAVRFDSVIRQPRGAQESDGFQLARSFGKRNESV